MKVSSRTTQQGQRTGAVGSVVQLWRYPVKSLRGEQCKSLDVNLRGVEGDRLFALRDTNGKLGSGKSINRFCKIDRLFEFQAAYEGHIPVIVFPDGRAIRGNQPDIHAALSSELGQPVTLAREADTSHLDAGPIHLLTTASLAWLRATLPNASTDERRFRPNLLVDAPGVTQIERGWLGKILSIGDTVRLRVRSTTERCVMVTFAQADLGYDVRILQCIAEKAALHFGVYAEILMPGRITLGDSVTVVD